jgi:hypothetical protein
MSASSTPKRSKKKVSTVQPAADETEQPGQETTAHQPELSETEDTTDLTGTDGPTTPEAVESSRVVRRRTTRTVKRDGETYTSETHEVVEDFEVPPVISAVEGDFPTPVG